MPRPARQTRLSRPPVTRRTHGRLPTGLAIILALAVSSGAGGPRPARAADLPPQLMARFTKTVQPLLLNKCAAGACHGGPSAHAPHLHRGDVSGRIDRGVTLANIEALFAALGEGHDATPFLKTVTARHPQSAAGQSLTLAPLTTAERATLEQWLVAATGRRDSPASALAARPPAAPPAARPNRFRAMLDAAANPPPLPPPQEPQGIILGKDGP